MSPRRLPPTPGAKPAAIPMPATTQCCHGSPDPATNTNNSTAQAERKTLPPTSGTLAHIPQAPSQQCRCTISAPTPYMAPATAPLMPRPLSHNRCPWPQLRSPQQYWPVVLPRLPSMVTSPLSAHHETEGSAPKAPPSKAYLPTDLTATPRDKSAFPMLAVHR